MSSVLARALEKQTAAKTSQEDTTERKADMDDNTTITGDGKRKNVIINVEGLIVGRYDAGESTYQIGVIPDDMPDGHRLTICYEISGPLQGGATRVFDLTSGGRFWTLEVEGQTADAELFRPIPPPDRTRTPDIGSPEARAFGWILDLEGDEFEAHPKRMPLIYGKLLPIIDIKNGAIYNGSVAKTPLLRTLNNGSATPFGKVSAILEVALNLDPRQYLVLRDTKSKRELFRFTLKADEIARVFISNVPAELPRQESGKPIPTHFRMFYTVFDLGPKQQYDFFGQADHVDLQGKEMETGLAEAVADEPPPPKCGSEKGDPGMICGTTHLGKFDGPLG